LVLCALQAFRQLRWTASGCYLLRLGATDCERTDALVGRNDRSTPHAPFWIARDSDKSAKRLVCHRGHKRSGTIHSRSCAGPIFGCRTRDRHVRNTVGVHTLSARANAAGYWLGGIRSGTPGAFSSGGCGCANPMVPGGGPLLACRVSTRFKVVIAAKMKATTAAAANRASEVR
jgi:hypothetical protein